LEGRWVSVLPYRLVAYVAPECRGLAPIAEVRTKRVLMTVVNSVLQKAELCYDSMEYSVRGKACGTDAEVELESKGLPRDDVGVLADLLAETLRLAPSAETKYERAIRLSGLAPSVLRRTETGKGAQVCR